MNNLNTPEYIQKTLATLFTTLRKVSPPGMPRVERPPDAVELDAERTTKRAHPAELAPEHVSPTSLSASSCCTAYLTRLFFSQSGDKTHADVVLRPADGDAPVPRGGMKLLPSKQ
jgi:hypothetical protein